jgi:uncharacterized protein with HEPN domain
MPKDPTIAIRDCLAEIAVLHQIATATTLQAFREDPIVRRAAAYAVQTISEAVRKIPDDWLADYPTEPWEIMTTDAPALRTVMEAMFERHSGDNRR